MIEHNNQVITGELWSVVSHWDYPQEEMVAYRSAQDHLLFKIFSMKRQKFNSVIIPRSFKPFFPLLVPKQEEAVQLWAVWAIHHVCTKNPAR